MTKEQPVVPIERIASRIYLIRGQTVMLDEALAELYGVPTGRLNEAVSRNRDRFPADFMFRLSAGEFEALLSQTAMANRGRGGRRSPPRAFTEQGVAMLSSVLRSQRAIAVSVAIMRAFVRLRRVLASNEKLARRLAQYDKQIALLMKHVKVLLQPPDSSKKHAIGFRASENDHE